MLTETRPIQVAYPASDHLPAPPPTEVRHHITGEDTTKPVLRLVFVGNVIPRKGLHTVIEGLALLRRADYTIPWKLDVVGSLTVNRAYAAQIQRQVAEHRLTDRVTFRGRIPDQKLSAILMAANILMAPSFEGFGIVYLEAMRHGLCPIAATAGAASEIVQHGMTGHLVPSGDPAALANLLSMLIKHPAHLQACRQRALDCALSHPVWSESFRNTSQWLHEAFS
jgi:glycosyltransferase involved in cell wall biosynthesis